MSELPEPVAIAPPSGVPYVEPIAPPPIKSNTASPLFNYKNEDAIHPTLLCMVCYKPFPLDAVVHNPCRSIYCNDCIRNKCPVCRKAPKKTSLRKLDIPFMKQLSELEIHCNRCDKDLLRGDFDGHECIQPCVFCCIPLARCDVAEHEGGCQEIDIVCETAEYRSGCEWKGKRR